MPHDTPSANLARLLAGLALAAATCALANALLIVLGKGVGWRGALAFAATNGVLWFLAAPAAMALGRRLDAKRSGIGWQVLVGAVCAPLFGALQGTVAIAQSLRAPASPVATAFFYLDLNVMVLVLAAVALHTYARRVALAEHARTYFALEARLLDVRHDLLSLQLQPHFLFNSLNSVVELIRESPSEAARVLRNLRTLFLATTRRSASEAVSLAEELDVVDAFIGVTHARHADRLEFRREIADDALGASIPPLSLQPLVENAVQFALMSDDAVRRVTLRAVREDGRLRVRVTNPCSRRDRRTPGLGIGLRNTRERLQHLFGANQSLTLVVSAETAVAELDIPYLPVSGDRGRDSAAASADRAADGAPSLAATTPPAVRGWRAAIPRAARIVGFWLMVWLFWVGQMHFYRVARGISMSQSPFVLGLADLLSALSWMVLTPLAILLGRRVPVRGARWPLALLIHVLAALAASGANIAAIASLYGLGALPIDNVLNQVVVNFAIYSLLVLWTHAEQIARWFDERRTATRRLEAELARARWDAVEMRLQPEAIAGELERLAALVEVDAAEAEERVLDMADTLRRLLQSPSLARGDDRIAISA